MWEVVRWRYQQAGSSTWRRARVGWEVATDLVRSAARERIRTMGGAMRNGRSGVGLDVVFVLRSLRRSPGYALTAVVVLAGTVAVNATVYSFVRGTLLNEPTYADSDGSWWCGEATPPRASSGT